MLFAVSYSGVGQSWWLLEWYVQAGCGSGGRDCRGSGSSGVLE